MVRTQKIIIRLVLILMSGVAVAAPGETPARAKKGAQSNKFSGAKLKGKLKKPELCYIYRRKGIRSEQIIDIPKDFNYEIISGARQF